METKRRIAAVAVTALFTVGLALNFSGCSKESTMGPTIDDEQSSQVMSLAKNNGKGKGIGKVKQDIAANTYPQTDEITLTYSREYKGFWGGNMQVDNGSKFHVNNFSFTPPPKGPKKKPVTLTMKVEKVGEGADQQLIFTFGPSESTFSPPAEIRLNWADLGFDVAKLYYIHGNKYIEQTPDQIEVKNKTMTIYVDHFSRYALAHSE